MKQKLILSLALFTYFDMHAGGLVLTRDRKGEDEEFWKPVVYQSIQQYPASVVITNANGTTTSIPRLQVGEVVELPDWGRINVVTDQDVASLKTKRTELATLAGRYKNASQYLNAEVSKIDTAILQSNSGNVLVAGQWMSKSGYDQKVKELSGVASNAIPVLEYNGMTFHNVAVKAVDGDKIKVMHDGGIATLKTGELSTAQIESLKKQAPTAFTPSKNTASNLATNDKVSEKRPKEDSKSKQRPIALSPTNSPRIDDKEKVHSDKEEHGKKREPDTPEIGGVPDNLSDDIAEAFHGLQDRLGHFGASEGIDLAFEPSTTRIAFTNSGTRWHFKLSDIDPERIYAEVLSGTTRPIVMIHTRNDEPVVRKVIRQTLFPPMRVVQILCRNRLDSEKIATAFAFLASKYPPSQQPASPLDPLDLIAHLLNKHPSNGNVKVSMKDATLVIVATGRDYSTTYSVGIEDLDPETFSYARTGEGPSKLHLGCKDKAGWTRTIGDKDFHPSFCIFAALNEKDAAELAAVILEMCKAAGWKPSRF